MASKIEQRENRIQVNVDNVLCMVHSLNTLMFGVYHQCCWSTADGVLDCGSPEEAPYNKQAINGREWVVNNYDTVSGAIAVAKDITNLLSEVFVNYDVTVTE